MSKLLQPSIVLLAAAGILAPVLPAQAKAKKSKKNAADANDAIEVVAHISAPGGPITRFLATQHYSSSYLYLEHENGRELTLIDVSQADKPLVLADIPTPSGSSNLYAVAGSAALFTDDNSRTAASAAPVPPQNVRIMDLSDPKNPKVARQFTGVTALMRDDRRGLIFLANSDGVWVLHQRFATDPQVEKEYTRHVLYDH